MSSAANATSDAGADKFAGVEIKAEKVAGSVYVLYGEGGNIGASIGEDGIVLVDDEFAPLADRIKAALRGVSDKPLRFILNTHWHGDHTGGNAIFGESAPIVAHENVRKRLASGAPERVVAGKHVADAKPPAPRGALPVVTFADAVAIHLNGEEVRVHHVERAHTDGDSVVLFTKSNVVHMGDVFVTYGFPYVDRASGGTVKGMIAGIRHLLTELPADVKVIPGHGKVATLDDVRKFVTMLEETRALVDAAVKKKKTLDELKKSNILAKYASYSGDFVTTENWIEALYEDVTPPAK